MLTLEVYAKPLEDYRSANLVRVALSNAIIEACRLDANGAYSGDPNIIGIFEAFEPPKNEGGLVARVGPVDEAVFAKVIKSLEGLYFITYK